jgi:formamidopyrimidine-DNA glycosylase
MSGDLAFYRNDEEPPRFARVIFDFEDGTHLAFDDMRLFGVVDITPDPDAFIAEHRLGPDPLDTTFSLREFRRIASGRRGAVKALLMSQDVIAGMGNLYVDETLYRSSIHPRRAVDVLSDAEVKAIFTNMRAILKEAIRFKSRGDDYPGSYLVQHREEGDRCPRCGGTIQRTVVFGRTTYFCAKHQLSKWGQV